MALHGNTVLELAREKKINGRIKREVVNRIEKHNVITGYASGLLNAGNYGLYIPRDKLLPLRQFFDGCQLTDNENNASVNMIAHDAMITACSGNGAYSGSNTKRGSFNSTESGMITSPNGYKGFRNVFDWSTSQGNGTIASVCLTRSSLAIAEYTDSAIPAEGVEMCEVLYDYGNMQAGALPFGRLHIIDYEKEVAYRVEYSSGEITVHEYQLSTKNLHLLSRPLIYDANNTSYNPEYVGAHTITQTVANFNDYSSSISYTGDRIVIITWSGSAIKAYPISTSTWELGTVVEKTFNGVTFVNGRNASYLPPYHKDVVLLDGNYAWILATVSGVVKMLKIDLLGSTVDVVEKAVPSGYPTESGQNNQGCCVLMPNGDFYKFPAIGNVGDNQILYYHNGNFYVGRIQSAFNKTGWGQVIAGANGNAYGSTILNYADDSYAHTGSFMLATMHGFVSTVNNLDDAVTKTADLTMKLTYELTETSGS